MVRAQPVQLRLYLVEMRQIAHADRAAAHLVLIGRADAAPRRADLAGTRRRLAQTIEVAVQRQDQRAIVGNCEILGIDRHALRGQLLYLGLQSPGIQHHAIADDRQRPRHDARRQQRQLVGDIPDDQRMARVMPALKANHRIGAARQPVHDLAFAFVAPLGTDHRHIGQSLAFQARE